MSINFSIFMITLGIGFLFVYVLQPKPNIVIRYPTPENLENIILFQNSLVSAKMMIVNKLNEVKQLANTFIKTDKGFKAVNPEGYVAIDKAGNAVKLVDRMEFSYNNFTARKAWDK